MPRPTPTTPPLNISKLVDKTSPNLQGAGGDKLKYLLLLMALIS